MATEPKTLQDAIIYFSNPDNLVSYPVAHRTTERDDVIGPTGGWQAVGYVASSTLSHSTRRHTMAQLAVQGGHSMN